MAAEQIPVLTPAQALLAGVAVFAVALVAMNSDRRGMIRRVVDFDYPLVVGAGVVLVAMSGWLAGNVGAAPSTWAAAGGLGAVFGVIMWRMDD